MIVSTDTATSIDTSSGPVVSENMSNAAYHGEREHISRSTAHRYRGVLGGRAQRFAEVYRKSLFSGNAATGFGTIVDAAVECEMRGVDWRSHVVVPPESVLASDGSRRGKPYQDWKRTLPVDSHECSHADFGKVEDMIASIREHEAANELLEAATHSQLSVFWTDADGHKLKARADGCTNECWFDLKTTSSEWRDLKYSFRRFGYDWQASWYSQAAEVAGWKPFTFKFIVVQTFAPYDVKVLTLTEDAVSQAAIEIRETLDTIRRRRESGIYVPAEYHAVEELTL